MFSEEVEVAQRLHSGSRPDAGLQHRTHLPLRYRAQNPFCPAKSASKRSIRKTTYTWMVKRKDNFTGARTRWNIGKITDYVRCGLRPRELPSGTWRREGGSGPGELRPLVALYPSPPTAIS
ncbi:Hypothetical protein NTJ_05510 [Nesidiocoris tenuis]|uniref:Uncharacterized protein n=1 Tax=Nesidiocoris tenuis TaxID=355587 RepID=A0ABN7AP88_9HEMI|nr:Hypothetical protein NTJ_05510 [Nesidiocoris tenuis]